MGLLDTGNQGVGLLCVHGAAGFLQFLGQGCQSMRAERGARRFEGVSQPAQTVVGLSLPGGS